MKIVHSLCNGSSYNLARAIYADRKLTDGPLMAIVPEDRKSVDEQLRPGSATVGITPSQWVIIDAILELAEGRGGLPLRPLAPPAPWR